MTPRSVEVETSGLARTWWTNVITSLFSWVAAGLEEESRCLLIALFCHVLLFAPWSDWALNDSAMIFIADLFTSRILHMPAAHGEHGSGNAVNFGVQTA